MAAKTPDAREVLETMIRTDRGSMTVWSPTEVRNALDAYRDELAEANHQARLNEPILRMCLVPGCLREYDVAATMTGREPERPSWSGKGWHKLGAGTIFPSGDDICPDHVALVTDHWPQRVQLPSNRWTVVCACEWTAVPQTWHGVLRAMWEQHILTVTGKLPEAPPIPDPEHRAPLAEHTEATLSDLYDRLWDAEGYAADTMDAGRAAFRAYDHTRQTLAGVSRALSWLYNMTTLDSRDWSADRQDARLYAVLVGWGCENQHDHDETCGGDDLGAVAERHKWKPFQVDHLRELRAHVAAVVPKTTPAPDPDDEWIRCSHSHCPNAERFTKAPERAWQHGHMDTWLCPEHRADAPDSRGDLDARDH